jgi:hypothetical protein
MKRTEIYYRGITQAVALGALGALGLILATGTLAAQQVRSAPPSSGVAPEVQLQQRRFQFQLMEAVLENAVRQGAQGVMPTTQLFMGLSKARGFPLDHYGVVFDVEIPQIRESAVMLNQFPRLNQPAPRMPAVGNQTVANGASGTTARATGVVTEDPMSRSPVAGDPFLADPDQFYRNAVKEKLIDAMLDYSRSLEIGESEWLSVVARGEEDPIRTSIFDDSQTLILRIKGSDLAEFYDGKISREEARKRVVESQF